MKYKKITHKEAREIFYSDSYFDGRLYIAQKGDTLTDFKGWVFDPQSYHTGVFCEKKSGYEFYVQADWSDITYSTICSINPHIQPSITVPLPPNFIPYDTVEVIVKGRNCRS